MLGAIISYVPCRDRFLPPSLLTHPNTLGRLVSYVGGKWSPALIHIVL